MMVPSTSEPILREIRYDDEEGVRTLEDRVGFIQTPHDYWQQLWDNPTLSSDIPRVSMGWVMEADGRIVGHYANIPMLHALGDETVVVGAGKGLYVDPAFRGRRLAPKICSAYFNQDNADMLLMATTNRLAAGFFERFGARRVPQSDYDQALYWVLRPASFLRASLKKKRLAGGMASIAASLLSPLLRAEIRLRARRPVRPAAGLQVDVITVDEIGPEFDDLWARKRAEERRLLAYRTSEYIRWHFQKPSNKAVTRLFCARRGGRLVGYAIVVREEVRGHGLIRSRVIDLIALQDARDLIDSLFVEAHAHAAAGGSDILELVGFPRSIRSRFLAGRPFVRQAPNFPYYYKATGERLARVLEHESAWYACPFDGDASLRGQQ